MYFLQPLDRLFSGICLLALLYSAPLRASSIIDLGLLEGDAWAYPQAINNNGQVVGEIGYRPDPFLYSGGQMTDLLPPGSGFGQAFGINNGAQIVGGIDRNNLGVTAAWYTDGKWVDIIPRDNSGSYATGINDAGEIVGVGLGGETFSYSRGQVMYLDFRSQTPAINNHGQIAGGRSFYTAGQLLDLGTLGGSETEAKSINNPGEVVGYSNVLHDAAYRAFLYADGKMTDIGTLGGKKAMAYGINDSGDIVGRSETRAGSTDTEAFLYANCVMINLNSFLPEGSDWELVAAEAINNKGQVVGFGYRNGSPRGFLLDITPEPATLSLLDIGLVGVALIRRKALQRTKVRN